MPRRKRTLYIIFQKYPTKNRTENELIFPVIEHQ